MYTTVMSERRNPARSAAPLRQDKISPRRAARAKRRNVVHLLDETVLALTPKSSFELTENLFDRIGKDDTAYRTRNFAAPLSALKSLWQRFPSKYPIHMAQKLDTLAAKFIEYQGSENKIPRVALLYLCPFLTYNEPSREELGEEHTYENC